MRFQAPLTVEIQVLNDWRYYEGLHLWQAGLLHVEAGWPPVLIVKVAGIGFRFEARWERTVR